MSNTSDLVAVNGHSDGLDDFPIPIMLTFANATKVKILSGLVELSYFAGLEGDDETAWMEEAEQALITGFAIKEGQRVRRFSRAMEAMRDAFDGGRAQRSIDQHVTSPCDTLRDVARARAIVYRDEIDDWSDERPAQIDSAAGAVARKLAANHAVSDAEAAHAAISAFRELGFKMTWSVAERALERAAVGRQEREYDEAVFARRAARRRAAVAAVFEGIA